MNVELTKKEKKNYILFKVTNYHFNTPLGPMTYTDNPLIPKNKKLIIPDAKKFKYSEEFVSNLGVDPHMLINKLELRKLGSEAFTKHDYREIGKNLEDKLKTLAEVNSRAMELIADELTKEMEKAKEKLEKLINK